MINVFRHFHFSNQCVGQMLKDAVNECDVVLIENGVYDGRDVVKEEYSKIASSGYKSGAHVPVNPRSEEGYVEMFRDAFKATLSNSGKTIEVEKSPISFEEYKAYTDMDDYATELFKLGRFDRSYALKIKSTEKFLDMNKRREDSLEEMLLGIQNEMPGKNILATLGCAHLTYYKLKKAKVQAKQTLAMNPISLDSMSEYVRRSMLGMPNDTRLLAKTIPENIVFSRLVEIGTPIQKTTRKARKVVDNLSLSDIRDLSEYIGKDMYRRALPNCATDLWLRKRGIDIESV